MISVILTASDASMTLRGSIQSVIDQTYRDWELIIIDNGSTDNSRQIAQEYAAVDPRITVKAISRVTIGGAHSYGISLARHKWVTFLNGTDTFEPDALKWLWEHTPDDDEEQVNLVIGGVRRSTSTGSYAIKGNYSGLLSAQQYVERLLRGDFIASLGGKLLNRVNYLVGDTYLDGEVAWNHELITLVAKAQSGSHVYINTTEYIYNLNDGSEERQPGDMNFRGWLKSMAALSRFVENEEAMYLYRLHELYDSIIATGARFPTNHPEIKLLREEAGKYCLDAHEKHILQLTKSQRRRRREARQHAAMERKLEPLISVIMTCHNSASEVERAIESLRRQRFKDWELIAIDDFSVDRTVEIIRSIAATDRRIRLITSSSRRGRGGSRLAGMQAARGEYIGFINPVDSFAPDALGRVWEVADNTSADIVTMGSKMVSRHGWLSFTVFDPASYFKTPTMPMREALLDLLSNTGVSYRQCDKFYRRRSLDIDTYKPEEVIDDTVFNMRFMRRDGIIAWTDYMGYLWHPVITLQTPYYQLIEDDRNAYRRIMEIISTEDWDDTPNLKHHLQLGIVSHFLKYVARGLAEPWREGVRRTIIEALKDPGLVECLLAAHISPDLASVLQHGRKQYHRDRRLIKKFRLLDRF